jgi:hypothetical protein
VIDCVLSLNRNYVHFVVRRLNEFEGLHAGISKIRDLRVLINAYPTPAAFMEKELNYHDAARAETLSGVVDYVMGEIQRLKMDSEETSLARWANDARPQDYLMVHVHGFGLAGFQYLRMLFGANTTKPDVHIRAYVGKVLNRSVNDLEALDCLQQAAEQSGVKLRDLDTTIWEASARGTQSN